MNAINKTTTQVKDNVKTADAVSKLTIGLFGGVATLIGLWAVACFAGALFSAGPVGLLKGYISAVTGM